MGMIQTFKQAWRIPEMKKKMIFTLIMLVIFRLGSNIPVPGIDRTMLETLFQSNQAGLFGLFDMFTGGSFSHFTIFALGIGPYITSSIVLQLLTVAIPALEELAKQGEEGRKKINRITRYVAVVLALIQAVGYTFGLFRNALSDNSNILMKIVIVLVLVAGTAFCMWMGEQIDQKGVGNGISLLIFAGIVSRIPTMVTNGIKYIITGPTQQMLTIGEDGSTLVPVPVPTNNPVLWVRILIGVLVIVFAIAVIVGIILITEGARKVPVQYAKRVVGRKMYGGQSSHIPMKVNQAGVIPVIFAVSLLQILPTIAFMFPNSGFQSFVNKYLTTSDTPGAYIYFVLNILLIFAFTYFYGQISFNPQEIAENLQSNGGFIPGIRPGKPTIEYITKIAGRLTVVSAIFLAIVASIPTLLSLLPGVSTGFGGTSLIIAVGVALDTQRAIETQLVMRNYSGFLK